MILKCKILVTGCLCLFTITVLIDAGLNNYQFIHLIVIHYFSCCRQNDWQNSSFCWCWFAVVDFTCLIWLYSVVLVSYYLSLSYLCPCYLTEYCIFIFEIFKCVNLGATSERYPDPTSADKCLTAINTWNSYKYI